MTDGIETQAREIALSQGHRDADAIIVCTDGAKVPVWQFYVPAAEIAVAAHSHC